MSNKTWFETTWTPGDLVSEATTVGEMAGALEEAAGELRAMEADGVVLDLDESHMAPDDGRPHKWWEGAYACLRTEDPEVAEKYGFDEMESDESGVWVRREGVRPPGSAR